MNRSFHSGAMLAGAAASSLIAGVAHANGSSMEFHIGGHVDVFCQITPPEDNAVAITAGQGRIGMVRELCNTPSGYVVTASFTNLSGGVLQAAGHDIAVDSAGAATRMNTQAAMLVSDWTISKVTVMQPNAPVYMRVSISPR